MSRNQPTPLNQNCIFVFQVDFTPMKLHCAFTDMHVETFVPIVKQIVTLFPVLKENIMYVHL